MHVRRSSRDFDPPPLASCIAEQFEVIAAALRKEFGLTLFGFDCIIASAAAEEGEGEEEDGISRSSHSYRHSHPSKIEIIDVNFFPSYKEVEDFPLKLKAYLRRRAGME